MRKLVVSEYVTLDGVMQDPGGGEKGPFGGWSGPFWSDQAGQFKFEELFAADALLLGRVTYQGFAAAWPNYKDEAGFADRMNGLPKYVATTTHKTLDWKNSHFIPGDVAAFVADLKQQPGLDILLAGSATLVATLMQNKLVDEYRLLLHPVVVGGGKRLFPEGAPRQSLSLASTRTLPKGLMVLSYVPAAP
jgi:dihydrofolate reductase